MEEKKKIKLTLKEIGIKRMALLVLAGIVLLVSSVSVPKKSSATDDEAGETSQPGLSDGAYEAKLEKRLETILSEVNGVGSVCVMVTVSQSEEFILKENVSVITEQSEETDSQGGTRFTTEQTENREVVYTEGISGNQVPYVISKKMPVLTGVAVVAEGGGNAVVKQEVIALLTSLLPLEANRISVHEMKKGDSS